VYRDQPDAASGTGPLVTLRRYLDPVAAQLDKTRLSAAGIEAHVFEAASYNPVLAGAAGGTRLEVREGDLARAESLLHQELGDDGQGDGEAAGTVRCPRCELAYCFHEKMNIEGSSAYTALAFVTAPLSLFMKKRWHCHKCGHVWDDAKEGPAAMTTLAPGDPRPIFRLRRAHPGMGLFAGFWAGAVGAMAIGAIVPKGSEAAFLLLFGFPGGPIAGWLIGRSLRYDVCSGPGCRAPLTPDRSDCPRCKGEIAGVIHAAADHYSAAADFRRELAELRARDLAKKKKKKKKPALSPRSP
jgi:hypothetical protein